MRPHQIILFLGLLFLAGCQGGPKVVQPQEDDASGPDGLFPVDPAIEVRSAPASSFGDELHEVVVDEAIPSERYVFLKVREGTKPRWIATRNMEVEVGGTYFYRGGLLKTDFESKAFNRRFDTIYLVSSLVAQDHARHVSGSPAPNPPATPSVSQGQISTHGEATESPSGTVRIADLVGDPQKYAGKRVQIRGRCVKINPNIMERNWIHVQDGTRDDFDLVVTSDRYIPEGTSLTMTATVTLKKDFGAGYYYDLILEDGVLVE